MQSELLKQVEENQRNINRTRAWRLRYYEATGITPIGFDRTIERTYVLNRPESLKKQALS